MNRSSCHSRDRRQHYSECCRGDIGGVIDRALQHSERLTWAALRIVLLALAVSLAGLFLFPTKPAHAEVQNHELTTLTFGPITALTL